jgi:hypothetical protein
MKQQMMTTRFGPWTLIAAVVLAAGAAVNAQPKPAEGDAHAITGPVGAVRQIQARGVRASGLRDDGGWVYNTLDCQDCFAGLNIARNDPDCYLPGGDCDGEIYILPLNRTPVLFGDEIVQAPVFDDGQGSSWITDIFLDDYQADDDTWGDTSQLEPLVAFSTFAWTYNNYGSGVDKTFLFSCFWFSANGMEFYSGWTWELPALVGENWMYEAVAGTIDEPLDPADTFEIPCEGLLCLDYANETLEGHDDGGAFAFFLGGDLADIDFPYPTDLYALGYNDELWWAAGGIDDPNIDPDWDGEPGLSYLDVINTGHLVNWDFASHAGQLGHGYPTKMSTSGEYSGGAWDPCGDLDGDDDVDSSDIGICAADFGCTDGSCPGDIDGDGDTDQQDLAWLMTYLWCDGSWDPAPTCGPCGPVGSGTIDVDLIAIDNTDVGLGDDPSHPEFSGGVTHFTFDLVAAVTTDNDWTTQYSSVTLLHPGMAFFNHSRGDNQEPQSPLLPTFPALEFDSFYAHPPALFDGGVHVLILPAPDWSGPSVEATWLDTPYDEDYIAGVTQRFTLIVPENSGILPGVLPDDCVQDYPILAHVSTNATAKSTGADLHHHEFTIVDLAQPICPGDADGDSDVDQADLGILLSTYELPSDDPLYDNRADFDCDGDVDQSDLGTLLSNYGADC